MTPRQRQLARDGISMGEYHRLYGELCHEAMAIFAARAEGRMDALEAPRAAPPPPPKKRAISSYGAATPTQDLMMGLLAGGPLTANDLARISGKTRHACYGALVDAEAAGRCFRSGNRSRHSEFTWTLREDDRAT